jgi:hypothetical protein
VWGVLFRSVAVVAATALVMRVFNVSHLSPIPYGLALVTVLALALTASFVPAWRASLLSPMVAIRNETDSIWNSARRTLAVARAGAIAERTASPIDASLLTEFIEASRKANSFEELLSVSLATLVSNVNASSALLLENTSSGEFCCLAAIPLPTPLLFKSRKVDFC